MHILCAVHSWSMGLVHGCIVLVDGNIWISAGSPEQILRRLAAEARDGADLRCKGFHPTKAVLLAWDSAPAGPGWGLLVAKCRLESSVCVKRQLGEEAVPAA